jgi:hypothetical protein
MFLYSWLPSFDYDDYDEDKLKAFIIQIFDLKNKEPNIFYLIKTNSNASQTNKI